MDRSPRRTERGTTENTDRALIEKKRSEVERPQAERGSVPYVEGILALCRFVPGRSGMVPELRDGTAKIGQIPLLEVP